MCGTCGTLQIETPIEDVNLLYPINYRSFSSAKKSLAAKIKRKLIKNSVANELGIGNPISEKLSMGAHIAARSLKNRINKETKILDVGCGSGELIEALSDLGYKNVSGVDPYIDNDINSHGWSIKKEFITELTEEKKYDVVMLHHSFEHMVNPEEVLQKIQKLLSPNGICLIRIPVCDSYAFEHYQENWVQLDAPRHVFLHTNKSMDYLAKKVGLKVEEIINDSISFSFIGSEQYIRGIALNSPQSFFKPFYKKIFSKGVFSSKELIQFSEKAIKMNEEGKADQRVYILEHP
jgi:ubiquinone/menaquinone biosynthesis C-methylase UbiE